MSIKVGIPGGMYYYYYYPLWKTFFNDLGAEVISSGRTNRFIVETGLAQAVDEACFPVKVFYGHVIDMCQKKPDYIFLPRLISLEPKTYTCPKVMGLTDMLRAALEDLPVIIDMPINYVQGEKEIKKAILKVGSYFSSSPRQIWEAYAHACQEERRFRKIARQGFTLEEAIQLWEKGERGPVKNKGDLSIGILGHGYILYDPVISMNIVDHLKKLGCRLTYLEMLNLQDVEKEAASLPKRVFWTLGRRMIGAAILMNKRPDIEGLVFVSCFGCGPDSFIGELIERKYFTKPFLRLTVDEHTGEAGVVTRLEAFCDMLRRRRIVSNENNVSSHG